MNVTLVISSITAIAAIAAPVITNIINNRHKEKMKRIEMYETKRIEVINEYVSRAEQYIEENGSMHKTREFQQYKNQAYLYMPKTLWKKLDELHNIIDTGNQERSRELLNDISKKLSNYTFTMPKRK